MRDFPKHTSDIMDREEWSITATEWKTQPKIMLKQIKQDIKKGVGKKCKSFSYGCWVCGVWMAFDILENFYTFRDK